ncbi:MULTISPECIES: 16S rRNA (uracil(1498)-N(3))-methyltransferase [unclassified Polaromonas]|uniref:16S rRNA (uracil(1498)-N(3))-methyltransferase n=1 Tax=unclassified Polaromonas TaxID=2638319 RepID=UPI000F07B4E6|nr:MULTISPECIES: 16S rRNA (uracil(1498)-N(3))-methyltransferase [unclassified Polaromonas]AYQ27789.1 16S rRNA (uracil(1498)-N(3))-methyltransferase [Polaromonas sp. SP1]QGJ17354.1 16S rRNA (uracil(1498)-N(3))-methyltransferase [Polaromonas sp. Pch-P]
MTARFYADIALVPGTSVSLPAHAARHVQVLRMQPGDALTLFNGQGDGRPGSEGEFAATVERMGRSDVDVMVGAYTATAREARRAVHLAVGMPANERMDWLIEKAAELGVASIQPLMSERSVLRIKGERADKKIAHWRGVAIAACEQCGRSRVPVIHDAATLADWLKGAGKGAAGGPRLLLSLQDGTRPLAQAVAAAGSGELTFLSGPEGGLGPAEEAAAIAGGFAPVTLGPRVLRAETAPLACLSFLALAAA